MPMAMMRGHSATNVQDQEGHQKNGSKELEENRPQIRQKRASNETKTLGNGDFFEETRSRSAISWQGKTQILSAPFEKLRLRIRFFLFAAAICNLTFKRRPKLSVIWAVTQSESSKEQRHLSAAVIWQLSRGKKRPGTLRKFPVLMESHVACFSFFRSAFDKFVEFVKHKEDLLKDVQLLPSSSACALPCLFLFCSIGHRGKGAPKLPSASCTSRLRFGELLWSLVRNRKASAPGCRHQWTTIQVFDWKAARRDSWTDEFVKSGSRSGRQSFQSYRKADCRQLAF